MIFQLGNILRNICQCSLNLSTQGHQEKEKQEKLLPEDTKLFQKETKCNTVSQLGS